MNIDGGADEIIVKASLRDCGVECRARFDVPVYSCIFSEGGELCLLCKIQLCRYAGHHCGSFRETLS